MLAQFAGYTAAREKAPFDCASCKGTKHLCLDKNEVVEVQRANFPTVTITKETYAILFSLWQERTDDPGTPELDVLREFNVCPLPLFGVSEVMAMELYGLLDGLGQVNLFDLQRYPARYVEAVKLIGGQLRWAFKHYSPKNG